MPLFLPGVHWVTFQRSNHGPWHCFTGSPLCRGSCCHSGNTAHPGPRSPGNNDLEFLAIEAYGGFGISLISPAMDVHCQIVEWMNEGINGCILEKSGCSGPEEPTLPDGIMQGLWVGSHLAPCSEAQRSAFPRVTQWAGTEGMEAQIQPCYLHPLRWIGEQGDGESCCENCVRSLKGLDIDVEKSLCNFSLGFRKQSRFMDRHRHGCFPSGKWEGPWEIKHYHSSHRASRT